MILEATAGDLIRCSSCEHVAAGREPPVIESGNAQPQRRFNPPAYAIQSDLAAFAFAFTLSI